MTKRATAAATAGAGLLVAVLLWSTGEDPRSRRTLDTPPAEPEEVSVARAATAPPGKAGQRGSGGGTEAAEPEKEVAEVPERGIPAVVAVKAPDAPAPAGTAGPGAGKRSTWKPAPMPHHAFLERESETLREKMALLPVADAEGAKTRREEQLERLAKLEAEGLLDRVSAGLAWLALHQGDDGESSDKATVDRCDALRHDRRCTQRWSDRYATTTTAMFVLALLDHRDQDVDGLFEPYLARGVAWLRGRQRPDGTFAGGRQYYSTCIALIALGHAAARTGQPELKQAAERGLVALAGLTGGDGGLRYGPRQAGDLSVTAWAAQAVEAARAAEVPVPETLVADLDRFLGGVWDGRERFAYLVGGPPYPSLYAAGMVTFRIFRGEADARVLQDWGDWLGKAKARDLYGLYYGVRAGLLLEGGLPEPWREELFRVAGQQEGEGHAAGSWEEERGQIGRAGRTLCCAFTVLTLEHALYRR